MYTKLPSGTKAAIEKPSSGSSQLGLVVIPDVMGLRPLFEDMVKNLSNEWKMPVCSFELYPDLEHLNVEERLAAASELNDKRVIGDAVAAAELTQSNQVAILGFCMGVCTHLSLLLPSDSPNTSLSMG